MTTQLFDTENRLLDVRTFKFSDTSKNRTHFVVETLGNVAYLACGGSGRSTRGGKRLRCESAVKVNCKACVTALVQLHHDILNAIDMKPSGKMLPEDYIELLLAACDHGCEVGLPQNEIDALQVVAGKKNELIRFQRDAEEAKMRAEGLKKIDDQPF